MQACANCDHPFDAPFCPNCGQRRVEPGIRLKEVIGDFISGLFNAEAPILRTLKEFTLAPGTLTRHYLAGKRKVYTPPVRYFLFGIAFYFIMRWLLNWDPVVSAVQQSTGQALPDTPTMQVNLWMSRNVNLLLPLWIGMLATFDRILFPRAGLSWVERAVHYLFAVGSYILLSSCMIPLIKLWPALHLINFVIIFGMIIWAIANLHGSGTVAWVKAVLIVPVSFFLYVLLASLLVAVFLGVPVSALMQR